MKIKAMTECPACAFGCRGFDCEYNEEQTVDQPRLPPHSLVQTVKARHIPAAELKNNFLRPKRSMTRDPAIARA